MKRIISALVMVMVLIGIVPNAWAENEVGEAHKRDVLNSLGIMSTENDSEFVTRMEFFDGLLHMVQDSCEEGSIKEILAGKGIILDDSDISYAKDNYITYNDAIASIVTILGYGSVAEQDGGYPEGYKKVARDIGILDGVVGGRTLSLERKSVANLFYNAIDVEPCIRLYHDNISFAKATGETILSIERDIYEISGLVEANQYTSLTGENGNSREQITIGGENYYINGTNAGELLGHYVKGYVQRSDVDDGKVIFLIPNEGRSSEIIIESENILSVSSDCSTIEYQVNETGRTKKVSISPKVRVIYNGRFYDKYTDNDLFVQNGNLRLIDNNSDKEYDCVFISSYETIIVEYTNSYSYEIYGKYTYTGALNYLKLDKSDENQNIHYYLADEEVTFNEIGKDDILTVQKTKGDSDVYANIYISRNLISGSATAFDQEEAIIYIDDVEYKVSNSCLNEIIVLGGIDLSRECLFYFDIFNNLAFLKRTQMTDYCLFYRIREYIDDFEYVIDYLNDNSEWVRASLARKVRYNGLRQKAETVFGHLKTLEPQVMIIKCNKDGEINEVMTANSSSDFTKTSELSRRYRSNPKAFDCDLYLESDAKVFVLPQSSAEGKDGYFVTTSSYLAGDKNYSMSAYDVDEYNFTKAISVKDNTETKNSKMKGWLIVNKIRKKMNAEGEVVTVVSGAMGSYFNVEFEGIDDTVFDGVAKGSIIKVGLNRDNKVDGWQKIQDSVSTTGDLWQDPIVIDGTVAACDAVGGKLKLIKDGTYTHLRCSNSTNVLIYTTEDNSIKAANISELVPGDDVYLEIKWAIPHTIIVVR